MHNPTTHGIVAKLVLHYLKGPFHHWLFFCKGSLLLNAYSDLDWPEILMIDDLPKDMLFSLVHASSTGVQKSCPWYPSPVPRLNIGLCHLLLLSFIGLECFFMNLSYKLKFSQFYGVITLVFYP
jgi:hypothetical protein